MASARVLIHSAVWVDLEFPDCYNEEDFLAAMDADPIAWADELSSRAEFTLEDAKFDEPVDERDEANGISPDEDDTKG